MTPAAVRQKIKADSRIIATESVTIVDGYVERLRVEIVESPLEKQYQW